MHTCSYCIQDLELCLVITSHSICSSRAARESAASGGMIVGLWDWRLVVILLAAFVISVVITRYVSVGSLTIMIGFFILYTVFAIHGDYNFTSNAKMIEGIIMAGIIAGMAVIRHWQNIKRLIAGTENKLSFGSKKA